MRKHHLVAVFGGALRDAAVGGFLIVTAMLLDPSVAWGQTLSSGSIAGVVRDTTGAVLPGVTVEAASPALIEKVRVAVSDEQGNYKIVDLRPGSYIVTFTLPGFATFKREGIELTTGFTATANADMKVGALEETVTVTGASPVVDIQNVRTQNVLTREVLDTLPTAQIVANYVGITLGATGTRDVAGISGETFNPSFPIHGAPGDGKASIDGMPVNDAYAAGSSRRTPFNQMAVQEIVLETGGKGAESATGGVNISLISKTGGNTFSASLTGDYSGKRLQSSNFDDKLAARGLTRSNRLKQVFDAGVGLGGPVMRDRLWFYTAHRSWGAQEELAGMYYNKVQGSLFYEPDLSRPAYTDSHNRAHTIRLTWQASQKNKVTFVEEYTWNCYCFLSLGATRAPESTVDLNFAPNYLTQGTWSFPATNRLLFEAGAANRYMIQYTTRIPETSPTDRSVLEQTTGVVYGAMIAGSNPSLAPAGDWYGDYGRHGNNGSSSFRFATSYVTGSHAFKAGVLHYFAQEPHGGETELALPMRFIFRNRVPVALDQVALPHRSMNKIKADVGIFVQDQWTIDRLTMNLGARFDYFNAYVPETTRPAGAFTPEFHFDRVNNVPNFKDLSPRLGAAYDLFGDGKTAFKVSLGKFMRSVGVSIAQIANPSEALAGTVNRTWNDANGNYFPDCDLRSPLGNGECGPMANSRFGTSVFTRSYADDAKLGWGNREFNWQASASVQHELRPGMAVNLGYFRTWYGNLTVADNILVGPGDFDEFCITAPTDSRLGANSGQRICGLYDVRPARFGAVQNVITHASNFGERSQVYNGVDISVDARFGAGGLLRGGVNYGRTVTDNCDSPDVVGQFCRVTNPESQVKFSAIYPLPWGLQTSATFQNIPGINLAATYVATNAEVAPSLGRNLASCGAAPTCVGTASISLIEPNTVREPRQTQIDFRVSKIVRVGRARVHPRLDVYNLLNSNDVRAIFGVYGPRWGNVASIVPGRVFKVGANVEF